jgi:type IV pilus assembly protein PilN
MIKINLLSEAKAGPQKKAAPSALASGQIKNVVFYFCLALGVAGCAGFYLYYHHKRSALDVQIKHQQAEVDRLKSIIDEVDAYEKKKTNLEAKINLIKDLKQNQKGPVRIMDEVSRALPDLVWLTEMSVAGNAIAIKGKSMTPNAVANFIENLKRSTYFAEPVFEGMSQETSIYSFSFTVNFTGGASTETGATGATGSTASPTAAPGKPAAPSA